MGKKIVKEKIVNAKKKKELVAKGVITEKEVPLSPEQLDRLVKGHKIVELFVRDNTLTICLDDGGKIHHKVMLTNDKKQFSVVHKLMHSVDEKKAASIKKYDSMYG